MKQIYFWACLAVTFSVFSGNLQGEEKQVSPEVMEIVHKQWNQGKAPQGSQEFINLELITDAFTRDNQGRYPNSWAELEKQYGENVWPSKKEWSELQQRVVFLPYVEGEITVPNEGIFHSKMVMVYAKPYDQKRDAKRSVGRWVLWLTSKGTFVGRWHGEEEIQNFSAWPQVQKLIDEAKIAQNENSFKSSSSSGESKQFSNLQSFTNLPKKVESKLAVQTTITETKISWWLIACLVIVAIICGVVVVRLVKK